MPIHPRSVFVSSSTSKIKSFIYKLSKERRFISLLSFLFCFFWSVGGEGQNDCGNTDFYGLGWFVVLFFFQKKYVLLEFVGFLLFYCFMVTTRNKKYYAEGVV
eukprot:PhF_6_TR11188/c0_g1_i2/m.18032